MPQQQRPAEPDDVTIMGAQFLWNTNFEGRVEQYNETGDRGFNVLIPENIADQMAQIGWNVKMTKPAKSATPDQIKEFVPRPFLEVGVGFKYRPPTLALIRDDNVTYLEESNVHLLDALEFTNVDMTLRGRPWDAAFGVGIKAWLKEAYFTVQMDDLKRKYAHLQG